jgi:hypothetical protein
LGVQAGQKLALNVKAADRFDLAEEPNIGTGDRWHLDVVTPQQLRTILEGRELVLRQRFEAIIDEVTSTRDLLQRMEFTAASGAAENSSESGDAPTASPGPPANDSPEPAAEQREMNLRRLRVERAQQNGQKDAHEILGVAEAFAEIRRELTNNRIDTTELKIRLEDGIVLPLRRMVEEQFPELDRRLATLEAALADARQAPQNLRLAVEQFDLILREMRLVLSKMIEMEDFNEAVELLRQIIAAQQKLGERVDEQQKQRLRDLLEE